METAAIQRLGEYGLAGIVIMVLGVVTWRLFKLYNEVQEKRFAEARESTKALENNTAALEGMGDVIRAQNRSGQ